MRNENIPLRKNAGRKNTDEKMSDEKMPDEKRSWNQYVCRVPE